MSRACTDNGGGGGVGDEETSTPSPPHHSVTTTNNSPGVGGETMRTKRFFAGRGSACRKFALNRIPTYDISYSRQNLPTVAAFYFYFFTACLSEYNVRD